MYFLFVMKFNRRDVVLGLAIVLVVILGALLVRRYRANRAVVTPTPTPSTTKQDIQEQFKYQIPENTNSVELNDVSGGDGRALATEKEILADIAEPASGSFYQAWLEKDGNLVSLGRMVSAKGGWMVNYDRSKYPDYNKIVVSEEKISDSNIEKRVLEGSF